MFSNNIYVKFNITLWRSYKQIFFLKKFEKRCELEYNSIASLFSETFMKSTIVFPFFKRSVPQVCVSRASPLSKVLLARAPFTAIRRRKRRRRRRKRKKYKMPRKAGEESGSKGKTGFLYVVMMAMPSTRRHQRGDVYTHVAGCWD